MSDYLWRKATYSVDDTIMRFMAGDDVVQDRQIFLYDIQATKAHVNSLASIELLDAHEQKSLLESLDILGEAFRSGEFVLDERFEDGHTAIEAYLTEQLGETGRKVHTGRSRNDQVLVATRLYLVDAMWELDSRCRKIAKAFVRKARAHKDVPMPGLTHLQHAVVSSAGLWLAGFAEAFVDNAVLADATHKWISANPLGTAAGYGVNLALDRDLTTRELGFERLQINPLYAQNSRGKFELQALTAISAALLDVRRFAWDLSLYSMPEFDYVTLPEQFTTGSSIMPNKRNPDLVELLRGAYCVIQGASTELQSVLSLPSGYHRDVQHTKAPLLRAVDCGLAALALMPRLVDELGINAERMRAKLEPAMYATDRAIELAAEGLPFRWAYQRVNEEYDTLSARTPEASIEARVSPGGPGDLRLAEIEGRLREL